MLTCQHAHKHAHTQSHPPTTHTQQSELHCNKGRKSMQEKVSIMVVRCKQNFVTHGQLVELGAILGVPTFNTFIHMWAATWQNQQNGLCAQWSLCPVWSVLAVPMKKHWALNYLLSAQWRLIILKRCPGWFDRVHRSFCWFCHVAAHICLSASTSASTQEVNFITCNP